MNADPKFNAAIAQEIVWKNPELQRFAVNLVRAAIAQGGHFTTDLVKDEDRGDGSGIAGSVVELQKSANVISPVGHTHHGQWFAMRCKSTRPDRKSAWLCVYQLTSVALASEFLRRHGALQTATVQQEIAFAQK